MFFRGIVDNTDLALSSGIVFSANTTLTSDVTAYYIEVKTGVTLTINPGVTVRGGLLVVDGTVVNNGVIDMVVSAGDVMAEPSAGFFKDRRSTSNINSYPS